MQRLQLADKYYSLVLWKFVGFAILILFLFYEAFNYGLVYALSKVSLLGLVFYCFYKGAKGRILFNPYFLFCLVPLSLLVYDPTVSTRFFIKLKQSTIWYAIINIVAFIYALNITKKKFIIDDKFLATNKSLIKNAWCLFGLYLLTHFIPGSPSFCKLFFYMALVCMMKSKKILQIGFILLIWIVLNASVLNKTLVLRLLIVIGLSYYKFYLVKSMRSLFTFKNILLILGCIFVMFIMFGVKTHLQEGGDLISYFSGDFLSRVNDENNYVAAQSSTKWNFYSWLLMPYMYFTTPWVNFQYVLDTQPASSYGLWILKPLLSWGNLDAWFQEYYRMIPYSTFNTYVYITYFVKDFGYWFAILASFCLGAFVKIIYSTFVYSTSPLTVCCYAFIAQATFELFFSNHFVVQTYPFNIVIICYLYRRIMR